MSDLGSGPPRKARSAWSPKEDELLRKLVTELGCSSWSLISKGMAALGFDTRHAKSCRLRWCNELSAPKLPITPEEEALLDQLVEERGRKWSELAKHPQLSRHTDNHLKNNWYGRQARLKKLLATQNPRMGGSTSSDDRDTPPARSSRKQNIKSERLDSTEQPAPRARRASRRVQQAPPDSDVEGESEDECPMLYDTTHHDDQRPGLIKLPGSSSRGAPVSEAHMVLGGPSAPLLHGYPRGPLTAPNLAGAELLFTGLDAPSIKVDPGLLHEAGGSSACSSPGKAAPQRQSSYSRGQFSQGISPDVSMAWAGPNWNSSGWMGDKEQHTAGRRAAKQQMLAQPGSSDALGSDGKRSSSRGAKQQGTPAIVSCSLSSSLAMSNQMSMGDVMPSSRPSSAQQLASAGMADWSRSSSMQAACSSVPVGLSTIGPVVALGGDDNIAELVDRLEAELLVHPTLDTPRPGTFGQHGLPCAGELNSWLAQPHPLLQPAALPVPPSGWNAGGQDMSMQHHHHHQSDSPSPTRGSWNGGQGAGISARERQTMLSLPVISVPPAGRENNGHRAISCSPLALAAQRMLQGPTSPRGTSFDPAFDRARLSPMSAPGSNSMSLMHERWRSQQHRMSSGVDGEQPTRSWSQRLPAKRGSESREFDQFADMAGGCVESDVGIMSRPASRSRPSTVQDELFSGVVTSEDPFTILAPDSNIAQFDLACSASGSKEYNNQDAAWAGLPAPFERSNHALAMDCGMTELELAGVDGGDLPGCLYPELMLQDVNMTTAGHPEQDTSATLLTTTQSCPGRMGQLGPDLHSLGATNHMLLNQSHSMQGSFPVGPGTLGQPPLNNSSLGSRIHAIMPLGNRVGGPARPVSRLARASMVGTSPTGNAPATAADWSVSDTDLLIAAD